MLPPLPNPMLSNHGAVSFGRYMRWEERSVWRVIPRLVRLHCAVQATVRLFQRQNAVLYPACVPRRAVGSAELRCDFSIRLCWSDEHTTIQAMTLLLSTGDA